METYYTRKEYNEMKSILNRKLKSAEKKISALEKENSLLRTQLRGLEKEVADLYPLEVEVELDETPVEETEEETETHVTEE